MRLQFYKNLLTKTIFIFLLFRPNMVTTAKQKILLLFEHVECQNQDANITESSKCFLSKDNITKQLLLNAEIKFTNQMNDIECKVKIMLERLGGTIKLHESELDICQALSQRLDTYILRILMEEVHRASNVPVNCPLKGHFLYYFYNFTINSKYYPAFIPDSKWSVVLSFSKNQRKFLLLKAFGKIVRKYV